MLTWPSTSMPVLLDDDDAAAAATTLAAAEAFLEAASADAAWRLACSSSSCCLRRSSASWRSFSSLRRSMSPRFMYFVGRAATAGSSRTLRFAATSALRASRLNMMVVWRMDRGSSRHWPAGFLLRKRVFEVFRQNPTVDSFRPFLSFAEMSEQATRYCFVFEVVGQGDLCRIVAKPSCRPSRSMVRRLFTGGNTRLF